MLLVNKVKVAIMLIIIGMGSLTFAQDKTQTEEDIIIKAQHFFNAQEYQHAMPLFAQLVSIHPENPDYNYKFGICTLFGEREDKNRPIRYLKIASQTIGISDNLEIYYYLGLAYHQNQDFSEAMKNYNKFLTSLTPESSERAPVVEKVNACLNGITLARKGDDLEIVAQSEFQKDNFHRGYRTDNFEGMLIVKPEQLVCNKEKCNGENSFVYISEPRDILYFSGYENEDSDNKDIFKVSLSQNGEWGKVEKLASAINTLYDEDYPVLTNNGTTLYFCSKGHNSLGEYDVFRAELDTSNNVFTQVENMGIGVNSPFNDILYIEDKEKEYAYFSSDRDYLNSAIGVFKVKLFADPFIDDQILAEASQNELVQTALADNENSSVHSEEIDEKIEVQLVANKVPDSDASKHAAAIIAKKNQMNSLADSAFMIVATTKKFVRGITNKRDRANSISQKKTEEAKSLEIQFDDMYGRFSQAENQEEFDKLLADAVKVKLEICQAYERSNKAKLIAWVYGQQIKTKNTELNELKKKAGEIQTLSIGGYPEEVLNVYCKMTNNCLIADSLVDYSEEMLAITQNTISYDIPEKELVFADKLKIEYQQQTMLASGDYKHPENLNDIPIVVVDNRAKTEIVTSSQVAVEQVTPLETVEQIQFDEPVIAYLKDEQLEINFEIDKPELKAVPADIKPISFTELLADIDLLEEEIEINLEQELITPIQLAIPFELSLLAQNELSIDDNVEVNFNVDEIVKVQVSEVIMPIYLEEMANNWMEDEELEIRNNYVVVISFDLIEPFYLNETAFNVNDIDETLEIDFSVDEITTPGLIDPIIIDQTLKADLAIDENEVEINFESDEVYAVNMPEMIEPIQMSDLANNSFTLDEPSIEINFDIDNYQVKRTQQNAIPNNGLFYLRELASRVMTIESSRSDKEILQLALTDYDELSYEELLFAASLASSPNEKLMIFNVAFVHIDRDWRAFNNAAVTAIHLKELDQAECFLHQASLISENNGKVFNNMGVLSCYRQEFEKAQDFFIAATHSGVDSKYNLQVVYSMTDEYRNASNRIIPGVSVMDADALSDIIDYSGSAE